MKRLRRIASRLFRRTPAATGLRTAAPLWVRGLTAGGRPIVLGVALLMCAPGEYHLAENAGWNDPFTYGMPVVLSAYAGIAAAVASTRRPGDRGRWSAIVGACLALGLAMAAQVVSHLISTGHITANQPLLIAATPPETHQDAQDPTASPSVPGVRPASEVVPAGARLLPLVPRSQPTLTLEREDTQDAARTPELEAGTGEDAEDEPRPEPPLMTSNDVADHYDIKPSTVRNWVALGRIPFHCKDASGRNLFHPDELPKFQVGVPV